MDVLGRDNAPFGGRVWQEIDGTISAVKTSNLTARRFLEVDGPYGLGLSVLPGEDQWLPPIPAPPGATPGAWNVTRPGPPGLGADPDQIGGRGTFLVSPEARPVPLFGSEFILGVRNVEGFDDECQPLDLQRATRAARDVALEEERLIYYGNPGANQPGLLQPLFTTTINMAAPALNLFLEVRSAIAALAGRGYPGHYALAVYPALYTRLYGLLAAGDTLLVDALRELFVKGFHMVPVIQPILPPPPAPQVPLVGEQLGVIVTSGRPYARLVVGRDWTTAYSGNNGVYHRFLITSSLRLEITEPRAMQVLIG